MKITLAYIAEEEEAAAADPAALLQVHPGAKVRKSDRHPPWKHIYLATREPGNATATMISLVSPQDGMIQ